MADINGISTEGKTAIHSFLPRVLCARNERVIVSLFTPLVPLAPRRLACEDQVDVLIPTSLDGNALLRNYASIVE